MAETQFSAVYNRFLGQITDDLYLELTPEDTLKDLQNLLINAIQDLNFLVKIFMIIRLKFVKLEKMNSLQMILFLEQYGMILMIHQKLLMFLWINLDLMLSYLQKKSISWRF